MTALPVHTHKRKENPPTCMDYTCMSTKANKCLHDFKFETLLDGLPPEHGRTSKLA